MRQSYDDDQYLEFLARCYQNPVVLLEISSICNFQCNYCLSRLHTRKKGFMPPELFERIVTQLPDITHYPLRLHVDGEPTLHPNFLQYGELLNSLRIPFVLATNGSRLSPELLKLNMEVLISISPSEEEFRNRTKTLDYEAYLKRIVNYVREWLESSSQQTIYIQVPNEGFLDKARKKGFQKRLVSLIDPEKHAQKIDFPHLDTDFAYQKPNGHVVTLYNWQINHTSAYRPESPEDSKVSEGFCSMPWQEMAILSDGRVSFCCVDLTGGTAFTEPREIWERPLLEIWRDERINTVRRNYKNKKISLSVCSRCLADFHNHELYSYDHALDTVFEPKDTTLFPLDPYGHAR